MNVAVIGFGYWGTNLVRNFNSVSDCKVKYVCDSRPERLVLAAKQFPSVIVNSDFELILNDTDIEAIIISTPVYTHFDLAKKSLQKGKHVLLEKPMCSSTQQAYELNDLALKMKKQIMVDHTFLYTGAVQKIKQLISSGVIGNIKYFDSTRINLGLFQPDVNVLWDLAPHDISVLNYLIDDIPYSVNATGVSHTNNNIENIAYLTINYNSGLIAHFSCSWTSPVKIRTLLIGGDKKMLVFNDLEPTEKIRIYDTGYDHKTDDEKMKVLVDYRAGDVYLPKVDSKEALFGMANDFISCIKQNKNPISDFESGLNVIKILEASQLSIKQNGKEIILN